VKDTDLYQHLLGLQSPWSVERVELDVKAQRVNVWAEHGKDAAFSCPECGVVCPLHDHDEERSWRHLDSCQFETHLRARVPRVRCDKHGVRQARVPWSEPRSRFTLLFERFAIDVLRETDVLGGAAILGITWEQAHHIMERAVARGIARRELRAPKHVGVDEKAIAKRHRYATLLNDIDAGVVIEVVEGRGKDSIEACLQSIPKEKLAKVEAFAMDMWQPYFQAVCAAVPDGASKVVFDRFHIVGHMNKALDIVRRTENRELRAEGDDRLVGTKYDWLYAAERIDEDVRQKFVRMRNAGFKTARAWSMKELLRGLWDCKSMRDALQWWSRWYFWASHSRLTPVIKVAQMILRHLPNVMTYFSHRITNAVSESINAVVRLLQKRAFGYRSFSNFRTAVLFRCGGLDLYPAPT
jgi:transposase